MKIKHLTILLLLIEMAMLNIIFGYAPPMYTDHQHKRKPYQYIHIKFKGKTRP